MKLEIPERLSATLTMLGKMTPAEADVRLRSIDRADPSLAREVHSRLLLHLSRAGDGAAISDLRSGERAPQPESTKVGIFAPVAGTTVRRGESPSSTGDTAESLSQPGRAGSTIRYQDLEELGHGTFGSVYRAIDPRTGQPVAVKTMRRSGGLALDFFKGEFRYLQGIAHPNLVQLLGLESDGSDYVISMELVPGEDFLSYVRPGKRARQPDLARLRAALSQLIEGVAALHRHRRLHRDLKPQNIRVTSAGRVVVLDFGLAAEAGPRGELRYADHFALGTVPYMAPEQFQHPPLSSTASDLYSLGVILYESLTGRWPFAGSVSEIVRDKASREPSSPRDLCPDVPEDLAALCMALLARQPDNRPGIEEIFRRLGHTPVRPADRPPDCDETPLLGRARELSELAEAYRMARRGAAVVVKVQGPSGIGKSVLVRHYTDRLRSEGAVVLAGRCYEHESVPYKALDPVIDELARYLDALPEKTIEGLTPATVGALVKVFPVLERIGPIERAARRAVLPQDLQDLRRSAFAALRLLLGNLRETAPLVIHIDDLQWGDIDSVYLLADLIRPPAAPGILWILAHRSEDANSACLKTLGDALDQAAVPVMNQSIHPLSEAETAELVVRVLGEEARSRTREIHEETHGNPYFVAELLHVIRSGHEAGGNAQLTLDGLIRSRVSRLPEAARQLLEVVAVSGRPLDDADTYRAAEGISDARTAAARLEAERLLRGLGAAGELKLETYHDRVREAVLSGLPADIRRGHHERLARTLEESGRADVEQLAVHFEGAGHREKAGGYYHQAGDQATAAVAFDQAASFFRKALELGDLGHDEMRALQMKLADSLADGGRGAEAGPLYLELADKDATGATDFGLKLRATDQFLHCGEMARGLELLKQMIASVDLPYPSNADVLQAISEERSRLNERGLDYEERELESIPPDVLRRVDVCAIGATHLSLYHAPLFSFYSTLFIRLALDSGEPGRMAVGLSCGAGGIAATPGVENLAIGEEIGARAMQMAEKTGDPAAKANTGMYYGYIAWSGGHWQESQNRFEQTAVIAKEGHVEHAIWQVKLRHGMLDCLMMLGRWGEISRSLPGWREDARRRGDKMARNTFFVHSYIIALAADCPDEADTFLRQGWEAWPHLKNLIGTYWSHYARGEIALYRGASHEAWDLIERETEWVKEHSLFELWNVLNLLHHHLKARAAVAVAAKSSSAERTDFHQAAQQHLLAMEQAEMPWTNALAKLVRAAIRHQCDQPAEALDLLNTAEKDLHAVDMEMYAAAARRQRGRLIGGDEGQALMSSADAFMAGEGVVVPGRIADMLVPGLPG